MRIRYACLGDPDGAAAVTLVAQAEYHLLELERVAAALAAKDVPVRIVVPIIPWKPLYRFRPTVRRIRRTTESTSHRVGEPLHPNDLIEQSRAIIVMNDWGVPRGLVEEAKRSGLQTFGLVEGVQDYSDDDTGRTRNAYRRVDHVFALGDAGAQELGPDRCTVVGSERLRQLWHSEPGDVGADVLINSNFSYGVLSEHRRAWVRSAATAADAAQQPWQLSRHTAERGRSSQPVASSPIGALLPRCSWLVTRFSTVGLDALALGVDVAYHNPHGETAPLFQTDGGNFSRTTSVDELTAVLASSPRPRHAVKAANRNFLHHHAGIELAQEPSDLIADEIVVRM